MHSFTATSEDDLRVDTPTSCVGDCEKFHHGSKTKQVKDPKLEEQCIIMESGDEYKGKVIVRNGMAVPHGRGVLTSTCRRYSYMGDFIHRRRDGYGKLVTENFVLRCKWRMDYPDLSTSARLDYANGDAYSGFLEISRKSPPPASPNLPSSSTNKVSKWLQSRPSRCKWGELVVACGDRYFGEWENDIPHGFGCYLTHEGDRYIGSFSFGKFHGIGTLFSYSLGADTPLRLCGVRFNECKESVAGAVFNRFQLRSMPKKNLHQNSFFVFDGVWSMGQFCGEGHVTLPNATRVTAKWRSATSAHDGQVVVSPSYSRQERVPFEVGFGNQWRECFQWELLLCGATEATCVSERKRSAVLLDQFANSDKLEMVQNIIVEFLNTSSIVRNAVKIFQNCFCFFFGTCRGSWEMDTGVEEDRLTGCCMRNALWGCIHMHRDRRITPVDLELALLDIFSFTRSLQRWVREVFGKEQESKLAGIGADMIIGRWFVDAAFQRIHFVLLNLYAHVYSQESVTLDKQIERMRRRATLDDMGVEFARCVIEGRLMDPYGEAVSSINQLGLPGQTLTSKLNVLMQWSRDINLSIRSVQAHIEEGVQGSLDSARESRAKGYRLGSIDDLLPIYQYVISQCCVQNLYGHVRLLADFSTQASFVDSNSQENFCVTTFLICAITLMRLSPSIRDDRNVLVPASLRIERMLAVIESIPKCLHKMQAVDWKGQIARENETCKSVNRLLSIVHGYLKCWIPHIIERTAYSFTQTSIIHQDDFLFLRDTSIFDEKVVDVVPLCDPEVPVEVRLLCWSVAGSLIKAVGLRFGLYQALSSPCFVELGLDGDDDACLAASDPQAVVFAVTFQCLPLPSFLLSVVSILRDVL